MGMTVLESLKESKAWNSKYELPLMHNNPWIYMAYAEMILRFHGEELPLIPLHSYYAACEVKEQPGLIHRWPTAHGGNTSHDELMGAAHLDHEFATLILEYLDRNDGVYDDRAQDKEISPERWNLFRFPWLRPYLAACAGYRVGVFSQIMWISHVVYSAFTVKPGDVGPHLRIWLMADIMAGYPFCAIAIHFWKARVSKQITLKRALSIEPGVLDQWAPDEWVLGLPVPPLG